MVEPPVWISFESWQEFHRMRRAIKAPLTPYAEKLILLQLVRLKTSGQDPQACLDQSICNSWRDVFPVRDKGILTRKADEETAAYVEECARVKAAPEVVRQALQTARQGIRRVS